ncbi:hypothetical protein E8L03_09450 [Oceanidesulfovibrio marinus]|uniref:Zinc finger DksA/TraR C4-type domain-containing protein n=1 Tax=Oceanidesulfovibrio marinus TaxID=370038 RepID=A0ABX6NHC0_9BACT|nr:hypothetical protein E8L03_09450 [Oceanidesulfovibrio marinus]
MPEVSPATSLVSLVRSLYSVQVTLGEASYSKEYVLVTQSIIHTIKERFKEVRQDEQRLHALRNALQDKLTEPAERGQKEQELSQIDREIESLEEESGNIRKALARVDSGNFGVCSSCGRLIEPRRLEAMPWTELCIVCARQQEAQAT